MNLRKSISVLLIAACSFSLLSFVSPASSGPAIVVKKGTFSIDKKAVNVDWALSNFKAALGEPDRAGGTYNKVHVYDKKCISVFEGYNNTEPSGIVKEMKIFYKVVDEGEYVPTGDGFTGTIKVDKLLLTKDLTPDVMKTKLKKWKETDSFMDHCFRMSDGRLYIYFQFNESETELVKVSIGPEKKTK
jgi:hypothetical protein